MIFYAGGIRFIKRDNTPDLFDYMLLFRKM